MRTESESRSSGQVELPVPVQKLVFVGGERLKLGGRQRHVEQFLRAAGQCLHARHYSRQEETSDSDVSSWVTSFWEPAAPQPTLGLRILRRIQRKSRKTRNSGTKIVINTGRIKSTKRIMKSTKSCK